MSEAEKWDERYRTGELPWDTGKPSAELVRVIAEDSVVPCRVLEIGTGTGTNGVWLAQHGFDVLGLDLAPTAVDRARARAHAAGVKAEFRVADVLQADDVSGPFAFFFDRGCYHVVRRTDAGAYVRFLERVTSPGARGLVLTGNAKEPHDPGPPVVSEEEIRRELGACFVIERLREFRFDEVEGHPAFLGWSCLVRKV